MQAGAMQGLVIKGLVKEYVPGKPVLRGINLAIAPQGITAVIGPSGTGKSTLLRCINRLVEPTAGEILLNGQDLVPLRGRGLRLTVMENVLSGRLGYVSLWQAWMRRYPEADIARAFSLLDSVGLPEQATRRADALSGGQRQRVGIARALMQQPELLLADEPTSSLDPRTAVEIMELMTGLSTSANVPLVVNIHNVDLARRFAQRIIGMAGGEIVFDGPPEALWR
jgi:phosphonate transport system ATP-binding protein